MVLQINQRLYKKFVKAFGSKKAHKIGATRAGAEHVILVQEAFDVGGADPRSGAEGAWAKKRVPEKQAKGKGKAGKGRKSKRKARKAATPPKPSQRRKKAAAKSRKAGEGKPKKSKKSGGGGKKRKFDSTPRLQDSGALVGSINSRATERGYEIGPADLPYASVHQFGETIPMTAGMRRFLGAAGFLSSKGDKKSGGGGKAVVTIPARPYIIIPEPWKLFIGEAYITAKLEEAAQSGKS